MVDLVHRFATSPERVAILRGLISYRAALRAAGIQFGLQWIDGSFTENCEGVKGRPPGDVDVVNLLRRPAHARDIEEWEAFLMGNMPLFDPQQTKPAFHCDAYFIDLDIDQVSMVKQASYWFGLFSHQRDSFRWKGLVQIDLMEEDADASAILDDIEAAW